MMAHLASASSSSPAPRCGQGTVENILRKNHPGVWVSVSATTRKPRPGEINGVNYWFLDDQQFTDKEEAGDFLETATVHGLARYGTPLKPVQEHLAERPHHS